MIENKSKYENLYKKIGSTPTLKKLKLAQDFVDEKLSYGFIVDKDVHIINSDKEIYSISELRENGYVPVVDYLLESKFPINSLKKFIEGDININHYELYSNIKSYLERYIYFQDEKYYSLIAIWIMGTYVFNIFQYYPYLHITADKGSGKTTLLAVMEKVTFNGSISANSTAAVIFREVQSLQPTMLLDEAENLHRRKVKEVNTTLLDILKNGFSKSGVAKRCDENYIPQSYSCYSPKVLAGINDIDEILADRVITIVMSKSPPNISMQRYTYKNDINDLQSEIREDLYYWGLDSSKELFELYTSDEILNIDRELTKSRIGDICLPILAIANLIDKSTKGTSNKVIFAMKELMHDEIAQREEMNNDENETTKILNHIHELVSGQYEIVRIREGNAHITNTILLESLKGSCTVPWSFKPNRLTKKLRELFGIKGTVNATIQNKSVREYVLDIKKVEKVYNDSIVVGQTEL